MIFAYCAISNTDCKYSLNKKKIINSDIVKKKIAKKNII
jgi:hypothetical protein